jgi:hypothetical protein
MLTKWRVIDKLEAKAYQINQYTSVHLYSYKKAMQLLVASLYDLGYLFRTNIRLH